TDVLRAVDRSDREVAALGARPVGKVAALELGAGVGRQFDVVDLVARAGIAVLEADVVEHEELGLGADVDRVADAGRLEIGLGALRGGARVTPVELADRRLDDVAVDDHHRRGAEGIDPHCVEVRLEDHVGLVDRLPAGDRRAVEHQAFLERVLVDDLRDHRQVLPLALGIGEAKIDPLDLLFLDPLHDVRCTGHGFPSWTCPLPSRVGLIEWSLRRGGVSVSNREAGVGLPPSPPVFPASAVSTGGRKTQIAASSFSPVRMRSADSTFETKILPSPMRPVAAAAAIASTTCSAWASGTTTSSFTLAGNRR